MASERPALPVADPAPLGLGAFALTTFLLSAHNALGAATAPLLAFFGFAIFYGGLAQFIAGMWEFRNRNVFGATAFSTYGGFWMGVAALVTLVLFGKLAGKDVTQSLGWILLAFAIFNTYMLIWSARINMAVFAVFLTLEVTEILLFIGNFSGNAAGSGLVAVGGYVGLLTALVAWYASAAGVINGMSARPVLPVGGPLWTEGGASASPTSPVEA
ncbi:MAG TPA: acetate uptake transporter [Candidatus Dormibacteraeota bacterium]